MSITPTFDFAGDGDALADVSPNRTSYRRRLVILMIDLSGSMAVVQPNVGRPVDALNRQLDSWVPTVRAQGSAELRDVEFAIITFSGAGVGLLTPDGIRIMPDRSPGDTAWPDPDNCAFVPASQLTRPNFDATGSTPMVRALSIALALGDQRVRRLNDEGISTGQVRVLLFSDGDPNEVKMPDGAWDSIVAEIRERRRARRTQLFAFGVPGANNERMTELVGADGYKQLSGFDFALLLDLILVATSADDPYDALRGILSTGSAT